eukprot:jgi/Botrbrau1/18545/Bobra.0870s0001.1
MWFVIKYVPYVADSKRAMDEYTSEIFMGGRSTIVIHKHLRRLAAGSPHNPGPGHLGRTLHPRPVPEGWGEGDARFASHCQPAVLLGEGSPGPARYPGHQRAGQAACLPRELPARSCRAAP